MFTKMIENIVITEYRKMVPSVHGFKKINSCLIKNNSNCLSVIDLQRPSFCNFGEGSMKGSSCK